MQKKNRRALQTEWCDVKPRRFEIYKLIVIIIINNNNNNNNSSNLSGFSW
jgi:hypothetical protein